MTTKQNNDISDIDLSKLETWADKNLFEHQKLWLNHQNTHRFINSYRQSGTTTLFNIEALADAIENGNNQFFFIQSFSFAEYLCELIKQQALDIYNIRLTNTKHSETSPFIISLTKDNKPWADIFFIYPEALQSYAALHGNTYIDQVGYTDNLKNILKIASALSAYKKHRKTLIATGEIPTGPALDLWNQNNPYYWHHKLSIYDANPKDLFLNIKQLETDLSESEFKKHCLCTPSCHKDKS